MTSIDNLTIKEARELVALFGAGEGQSAGPWVIGVNYFIRTVTMALTGRLVAVYPGELVLEDAAWIADTGRFAQAVERAGFSEVEPFPAGKQVIVGRASVIDAVTIGDLPRKQK